MTVGEMEISASFWLIKLFTTLNMSLQSSEVSPMQTRSLPLTSYIQFLFTCLLTKSFLLNSLLTKFSFPSHLPGILAESFAGIIAGAILGHK